ncbi:MAG: hypothetical protein WC120_05360 [Parcubacteria group bacterium]|jgi:hypothetical protein
MSYKFIDKRQGPHICGFRCDCGQRSAEAFPPDEDNPMLRCPRCGAWMWRDFSGIGIGGDLPSRHPSGYIKGALLSDDDMGDGRLLKEVDYVEKHHGPSPVEQRDATNTINSLAKERRNRQREAICDEVLAKVDFEPPKGLDMTDGTA